MSNMMGESGSKSNDASCEKIETNEYEKSDSKSMQSGSSDESSQESLEVPEFQPYIIPKKVENGKNYWWCSIDECWVEQKSYDLYGLPSKIVDGKEYWWCRNENCWVEYKRNDKST